MKYSLLLVFLSCYNLCFGQIAENSTEECYAFTDTQTVTYVADSDTFPKYNIKVFLPKNGLIRSISSGNELYMFCYQDNQYVFVSIIKSEIDKINYSDLIKEDEIQSLFDLFYFGIDQIPDFEDKLSPLNPNKHLTIENNLFVCLLNILPNRIEEFTNCIRGSFAQIQERKN